MRDQKSRLRTAFITYFPMFVATLSLCTAIFNGYFSMRFF
jgi:hypothetical protein